MAAALEIPLRLKERVMGPDVTDRAAAAGIDL